MQHPRKQSKEEYFNSHVRVNQLVDQSLDKPSVLDESLVVTDEVGIRLQLLQLIERLNVGIKAYDAVSKRDADCSTASRAAQRHHPCLD